MSRSTDVVEVAAPLRRGVRTLVLARWVGVAFGLLQVTTYATLPYPPGVQQAAFAVVALLAVSNLAAEVVRRRLLERAQWQRLALVLLVTDVLVLSGLTWLYAFDDLSALFAVLFLLPIEGAVLFGLPGAVTTWAAVAVLYLGRELFATRWGQPFEVDSVTFRVGLIGIVALVVGRLVRDLTEQRERAEQARDEVQLLDDFRTRVISMLAHDLRSPLASTRGTFELLDRAWDRLSDRQRTELVVGGQRQADRALLLVRDLLDMARAADGALRLTTTPVALDGVVDRVVELTQCADVMVDVPDLVVMADEARLEQVLCNLLDNSAEHGAGRIEVTARRDGCDAVVLEVRDHGPGVPAGVDLFGRFGSGVDGSVGLGLWIVRHLVAAMDGAVWHESAEPGARFVVRLPAVPTARVRPPAAQLGATPSSSASATTSPLSRS